MHGRYFTLESANDDVQKLSEHDQALLYKALYLNDMRIDRAEGIIAKAKTKSPDAIVYTWNKKP